MNGARGPAKQQRDAMIDATFCVDGSADFVRASRHPDRHRNATHQHRLERHHRFRQAEVLNQALCVALKWRAVWLALEWDELLMQRTLQCHRSSRLISRPFSDGSCGTRTEHVRNHR